MEIVKIEQVTDFDHLNLFLMKYIDRTGKEKSWIFASRSKSPDITQYLKATNSDQPKNMGNNLPGKRAVSLPDAVVVVPFHVEMEKLIMIREFRVPLGQYQHGFPAGLMDKGESIEQTAARELKEETGLDLIRVIRKSPPIYSSSGMTDESVALVYAHCSGTPSVEWNEDSEDITVLMLSQQEAADLINTPDLKFDVKSWIVLSKFAETGSL